MDELEARNRELVIRNAELQYSVNQLEESEQGYKATIEEAREQYKGLRARLLTYGNAFSVMRNRRTTLAKSVHIS